MNSGNEAGTGGYPSVTDSAGSSRVYGASYPPRGDSGTGVNQGGAGQARQQAQSGQQQQQQQEEQQQIQFIAAPRVKHTLARIETVTKRLNPELYDTLSYGASKAQLAELQSILREYLIPKDVVESYTIHDGQDAFSVPRNGDNEQNEGNTGFIYGLWWMSIEEVMEEYSFWRRLDISTPPSPANNRKTLASAKGKGKQYTHTAKAPSTDAFLFGSEMDPRTVRGRMRSCPEGFVREEYSHPSWLPLLKDGYGNYIGIDLDPPTDALPPQSAASIALQQEQQGGGDRILPSRGQVIAFGREIDTKTVLWNGWAESNAHDNLGGGGWARFLASYADDLASSSSRGANGRNRSSSDAYSARNPYQEEDDDYRWSQSGRQEIGHANRASQGLEWVDASPLYSGLGTIEALVERSKRAWAQIGLYNPEGEMGDAMANGAEDAGNTSGVSGYYPEHLKGGIERQHKPAPLHLGNDKVDSPTTYDGAGQAGSTALSALDSARTRTSTGASSANTVGSVTSENAPLGLGDGFVTIPPEEMNDGGLSSRSGLLAGSGSGSGIKSPMSPEPSLILSPPSPKDNSETFQPFPPSSPPPHGAIRRPGSPSTPLASSTSQGEASDSETPRRPSRSISPVLTSSGPPQSSGNGGLASPLRMSPNQLARRASKEQQQILQARQRTASSGSHSSALGRRRPPPPVAMPLGLPTLEFGNGLWESEEANAAAEAAYSPSTFDKGDFEVVIIDRR